MKNTPIDYQIVRNCISKNGLTSVGNASIREIKKLIDDIEEASGQRYIRMEMGNPGLPPASLGVEAQIEALKRGLFIQWYSKTEPNYLTGINEIDFESEYKILKIIENKIENLDSELKWMLNYYGNWDFAFEKKKNLKKLERFIENITDEFFPKSINRIEMAKRGQMGEYWNSLNVFKK